MTPEQWAKIRQIFDVGEVLLRNGTRAEGVAKLRKAMGIYRELGLQHRAGAFGKETAPVDSRIRRQLAVSKI